MPRTHILHKAHNALKETSNNLPWRTSLEDTHSNLNQLDREFQAALNELRGRQRKFVLLVVGGKHTPEESALKSGYSKANPRVAVSRLLQNQDVNRALSLGHVAFQLKHGIDSRWKRQKLVDLFESCTTKGSPEWNPLAATKCLALLQAMDGDVDRGAGVTGGKSGINIVIQTGVPEQRVVVDAGVPKIGSSHDAEAIDTIDSTLDDGQSGD